MKAQTILQFSMGPIFGAILGVLTLPIMAWYFSTEDIGRYSMLQVTISFVLLIFTLGLDQAYVREFFEEKDKGRLLKTVLLPGNIFLLIVFIFIFCMQWSISNLIFDMESRLISFLLIVSAFLVYHVRFLGLLLRMNEKGIAFSVSQILQKLIFLAMICIYIFLNVTKDFEKLIFASTTTLMFVLLVLIWNSRLYLVDFFSGSMDRKLLKRMLKYSFPLILSGFAFWALVSIDKIFLRSMTSLNDLGIYSISISFAGAALVLQSVFSVIWAPAIYKAASEEKGVDPLWVEDIVGYLVLAVTILWSCIGVFSWIITYILPDNYERVQYILLVAMAYPFLYTLSEATGVGIGIQRKSKYMLLASLIALLVNGVANYILIPIYGASGAGVASALAFFIFFVIKTEVSAFIWASYGRLRMYGFIGALLSVSISINLLSIPLVIIASLYSSICIIAIILYWNLIVSVFKMVVDKCG